VEYNSSALTVQAIGCICINCCQNDMPLRGASWKSPESITSAPGTLWCKSTFDASLNSRTTVVFLCLLLEKNTYSPKTHYSFVSFHSSFLILFLRSRNHAKTPSPPITIRINSLLHFRDQNSILWNILQIREPNSLVHVKS
jgi:hypothetical protein